MENSPAVVSPQNQVAASSSHQSPGPSSGPENVYRVVQTLGEGAFGEVVLVVDRQNPKCAVAMKRIRLAEDDEETRKLIRKEALLQRMLSKKGHDNVMRYIGMRNHPETGEFNIFLEYADGGELFDKIEPDVGVESPALAQHYFKQLINGLEYIHSFGVVHRDIKPENLLLTKQNVLKISDFGMATIFRYREKTRTLNMTCGTQPYAAPEVVAGGDYKATPIDIWSAGVVLSAMVTGRLNWEVASGRDASYVRWRSGTNLDQVPWCNVDVSALSLLKIILTHDPDARADIARILKHPWMNHQYGCQTRLSKRPHLANVDTNATQEASTSAKRARDNNGEPAIRRVIEDGFSSFSQPAKFDEMVLTQEIDLTQSAKVSSPSKYSVGPSSPYDRLSPPRRVPRRVLATSGMSRSVFNIRLRDVYYRTDDELSMPRDVVLPSPTPILVPSFLSNSPAILPPSPTPSTSSSSSSTSSQPPPPSPSPTLSSTSSQPPSPSPSPPPSLPSSLSTSSASSAVKRPAPSDAPQPKRACLVQQPSTSSISSTSTSSLPSSPPLPSSPTFSQ